MKQNNKDLDNNQSKITLASDEYSLKSKAVDNYENNNDNKLSF